jgi:hypothetical protein
MEAFTNYDSIVNRFQGDGAVYIYLSIVMPRRSGHSNCIHKSDFLFLNEFDGSCKETNTNSNIAHTCNLAYLSRLLNVKHCIIDPSIYEAVNILQWSKYGFHYFVFI